MAAKQYSDIYAIWKETAGASKKKHEQELADKNSPLNTFSVESVGVGLALAALVVVILGAFIDTDITDIGDLALELWSNVGSEFASIALTILVIDKLNNNRNQRTEEEREKLNLIGQLRSPVNNIARQACTTLWDRKWLQDGTLNYAKLWEADLSHSDLGEGCLQYANFWRADLRNARLWADLSGANFYEADLTGAQFTSERFDGKATFSRNTVLPDGTPWTPETDMERFTNPNHPEYKSYKKRDNVI